MKERGVKASFALGGIPAAIIDMYDEGLVRVVECSQSFDAVAARAIYDRPGVPTARAASSTGRTSVSWAPWKWTPTSTSTFSPVPPAR